ncbi:universal stress protein [Haladaptatus pallidirubidus]|uniref:universal stress protein n=1 Tax=Haladaptatus pallidirubidus TaxID=1008152 RepID=UPI001D102D7E|nr:universal stress protein [Haladaptatus pallidirubidus]
MTIVATLDDSNRASTVLSHASTLASDLDEPLYVLHVLRRSTLASVLEKEVKGQAVTENYEIQRIGDELVEKAAVNTEITHDPDAIKTVVRVGDPAEEIRSYGEEVGARCIVVGGRRRSPTGKVLFGSVVQQVMLTASVPVLNVPTEND